MSQFSWESEEPPEVEDWASMEAEETAPATGINNSWLAVLLFMGVEAMLFLIFIFAFLYLRSQGEGGPPPGVPPLDARLAAVNLLVLLLSGYLAFRAERSIRRYLITNAERQLLIAAVLGGLFLLGQGREFATLLANGITASSSLYGAVFFATIGFHGLHVVSGLVWLMSVWYLTRKARQTPDKHLAVQAATLYWEFVAGVWVLLFLLLYVS